MPTATKSLSSTFTAVAQGPGTYYLEFEDEPGEWLIHTASASAGSVSGFRQTNGATREVVLAGAGDFLQVRGRGELRVAGTTIL